jgi:predicted HTH domain antitoxin
VAIPFFPFFGPFPTFFRYPEAMQHVTISVPDELLAVFSVPGKDLSRAAVEALALEAYRTRKISAAQLRRLLGFQTRMELDAFLKDHGVELEYSLEDLERDRETHRQLGS